MIFLKHLMYSYSVSKKPESQFLEEPQLSFCITFSFPGHNPFCISTDRGRSTSVWMLLVMGHSLVGHCIFAPFLITCTGLLHRAWSSVVQFIARDHYYFRYYVLANDPQTCWFVEMFWHSLILTHTYGLL